MFHRKKGHKQKRSRFKGGNNGATNQRKNEVERTAEKDQHNNIDRLLDLPESILHQILLCLPLPDTVSTKALSRRWRQNVWPSCPIIYFDEYFFGANYFQFDTEDRKKRKKFKKFLSESLKKQKKCINGYYNIDKFGLRMACADTYTDSIIDEWVQFALDSNVKELDLRIKRIYFNSFKSYNRLVLVDCIFAARSITVLHLEYCKIQPICSINLPSLKKLTLSESSITDDVFHNLILGCPLIEHLCVEFCKGLQRIEVSTPNLKSMKLNFSGLYRLAIESLSLGSVEWSGDYDGCEVDFVAFGTVKDMTLKNLIITDVELEHLISWCPMLVSLVIDGCRELRRIRVCCQHLERIVMHRCGRIEAAEIDTTNLVSMEYSGDLISFNWANGLRLVDVNIKLDPTVLDADWYIRLRRFIKQLLDSKLLTLVCRSEQAVNFPGDLSENLLPPLRALKHLKLEISCSLSTRCSTIVNGLVWIFPGLETLTIKSASTDRLIKL